MATPSHAQPDLLPEIAFELASEDQQRMRTEFCRLIRGGDIFAGFRGDEDISRVQELIDRGMNVNILGGKDAVIPVKAQQGWVENVPGCVPPLFEAAARVDEPKLLKMLLSARANLARSDTQDRAPTPLFVAVKYNVNNAIFLSGKVDIKKRNGQGEVAFDYAKSDVLAAFLTARCTDPDDSRGVLPPVWLSKQGLSEKLLNDDLGMQAAIENLLRRSLPTARLTSHGGGRCTLDIVGGRMETRVFNKCAIDLETDWRDILPQYSKYQRWRPWDPQSLVARLHLFVAKPRWVAVQFAMLASIDADDAMSPEVISAIAYTTNAAALATPAIEMIVTASWARFVDRVFLEIALNTGAVVAGCSLASSLKATDETSSTRWASIYLWCIVVKRCTEEVLQMATQMWWPASQWYLSNCNAGWMVAMVCAPPVLMARLVLYDLPRYCANNITDIVFLTIGLVGLWTKATPALALFFPLLWMRLLYTLRTINGIGQRVLPIFRAARDTGSFAIVVAFSLAAGIHAYFTLGPRDEPSRLYAAIMQIARLGLFGDFDLFEFEGVDPVLEKMVEESIWEPVDPQPTADFVAIHLVFYTVGVGITIFLMNLLVGILGAAYDSHQDKSMLYFLQARAEMMVMLEARPWHHLFRFSVEHCFCCKRCRKHSPSRDRYLYAIVRDDLLVVTEEGTLLASSTDETTSMRSHMKDVKNCIKEAKDEHKKELATLSGDVKHCTKEAEDEHKKELATLSGDVKHCIKEAEDEHKKELATMRDEQKEEFATMRDDLSLANERIQELTALVRSFVSSQEALSSTSCGAEKEEYSQEFRGVAEEAPVPAREPLVATGMTSSSEHPCAPSEHEKSERRRISRRSSNIRPAGRCGSPEDCERGELKKAGRSKRSSASTANTGARAHSEWEVASKAKPVKR